MHFLTFDLIQRQRKSYHAIMQYRFPKKKDFFVTNFLIFYLHRQTSRETLKSTVESLLPRLYFQNTFTL